MDNLKNKINKEDKQESKSFKLSFESKKKPTKGIVFKKRNKEGAKQNVKLTASNPVIQTNLNPDPIIGDNKDKEPINRGHIKRKNRKDKLLNKQKIQQGEVPEVKSHDHKNKNYSLFSEKERSLYVNARPGKSVSEQVFCKGKKFGDLNIHKHLISNLEKLNFNSLTNVQEKAIPIALEGKNVLIRSQTGSGKTLAYAIPIIDALQSITPRIKRSDGVQALVVVPTRELALQTHDQFNKINTFQWIVTGHLCGGESRKTEKDRIRKGTNVLIGTPGRLLDHCLHTTALNLSKVRCLVLDEADRLLDMGFRKDVIALVEQIDKAKSFLNYDPMAMIKNKKVVFDEEEESTVPVLRNVNSTKKQTILLSATLNKDVSELAELTMKDHVYVDALDGNDKTTTKSEDDFVIPDSVRQEFLIVPVKHRLFTLSALIVAKAKAKSKLFVFMASTHMVEFHYDLFENHLRRMPRNRKKSKLTDFKGEKVVEFDELDSEEDEDEIEVVDVEFFKLHGNMDQKDRKEVFSAFRSAKKGVLLCTDVAARGLDVPEADCIIQYTPPQSDKDYLHRVGRTGRAGKTGSAIIFLTHEEQEYITHLQEHKVFLKRKEPKELLANLGDLMQEQNVEEAATALQRHLESRVAADKALTRSACFAYSTWSRFYNSYPSNLRKIFDFKRINLGHYVTSFALTITPTEVSKIVRGQVEKIETAPLNRKLSNHADGDSMVKSQTNQKKRKSISLATSEYSSGLEPVKKKIKK